MSLVKGVLIGLVLVSSARELGAQTYDDVELLHNNLLSRYNKDIRPMLEVGSPVVVNLTFSLLSIRKLDEVNGEFSVSGYFTISWYDHRLSWNPSDYNLTYDTVIPTAKVWTPPIILVNSYDYVSRFGQDFFAVTYSFDGLAFWYPGDVISSTCSADVTYFPFDKQICVISFELWDYDTSQMILQAADSDVLLNQYTEHGTWELVDGSTTSYIDDYDEISAVDITITVRRRSTFYVFCYVLPILLLIPQGNLVFFLPIESGERVSYSITVLLAVAVFLTLVGENLPDTSKPMSYLCYFLLCGFALNSISCCINIFSIFVYYQPDSRIVPKWIKWFIEDRDTNVPKNSVTVFKLEHDDKKDNSEIDKPESLKEMKDGSVTWVMVSKYLDRAMIILTTVGFIAYILTYYSIMRNNT